jgi:hypothetical protein
MKTPDTIEDQIDKIRLAIYEEIKGMTHEQRVEFCKQRTDPIIKQYGFKVVASAMQTMAPLHA